MTRGSKGKERSENFERQIRLNSNNTVLSKVPKGRSPEYQRVSLTAREEIPKVINPKALPFTGKASRDNSVKVRKHQSGSSSGEGAYTGLNYGLHQKTTESTDSKKRTDSDSRFSQMRGASAGQRAHSKTYNSPKHSGGPSPSGDQRPPQNDPQSSSDLIQARHYRQDLSKTTNI